MLIALFSFVLLFIMIASRAKSGTGIPAVVATFAILCGLAVGVPWITEGSKALGIALQSASPRSMTLAEFAREQPASGWFRITDGSEALLLTRFPGRSNQASLDPDQVFVPLVAAAEAPANLNQLRAWRSSLAPRIALQVHVHDPAVLATMADRYQAFRAVAAGTPYAPQRAQESIHTGAIEGAIGLTDTEGNDKQAIALEDWMAARPRRQLCPVLEEGEKPMTVATQRLPLGILLVFGPLILSGVAFARYVQNLRNASEWVYRGPISADSQKTRAAIPRTEPVIGATVPGEDIDLLPLPTEDSKRSGN